MNKLIYPTFLPFLGYNHMLPESFSMLFHFNPFFLCPLQARGRAVPGSEIQDGGGRAGSEEAGGRDPQGVSGPSQHREPTATDDGTVRAIGAICFRLTLFCTAFPVGMFKKKIDDFYLEGIIKKKSHERRDYG